MTTIPENFSDGWFNREINFFQTTGFFNLPIVYEIELSVRGDIRSSRINFINQRGLKFLGYTPEEIQRLGFDFYGKVVHPHDMELLNAGLERNQMIFIDDCTVDFHQFKSKDNDGYNLFFCAKLIKEVFDDGSMKKILVSAYKISDAKFAEHEFPEAFKEILRYKHSAKLSELSEREMEVWHLIVKDFGNKAIADKLFISANTVNVHRVNLMRKLGAHTAVGLTVLAYEYGEF